MLKDYKSVSEILLDAQPALKAANQVKIELAGDKAIDCLKKALTLDKSKATVKSSSQVMGR